MYINSSNNRAASTIYVYPRESKRINGLACSLRLLYFLKIKELKKSTIVCVVDSKFTCLSSSHLDESSNQPIIVISLINSIKQASRLIVLTRLDSFYYCVTKLLT